MFAGSKPRPSALLLLRLAKGFRLLADGAAGLLRDEVGTDEEDEAEAGEPLDERLCLEATPLSLLFNFRVPGGLLKLGE